MFGHAPTIAQAIMRVEPIREAVLTCLLQTLSTECSQLCQRADTSLFRSLSVTALANGSHCWNDFLIQLSSKAPTLLEILLTLVSFNDNRNKTKAGTYHYPGVCVAVAVLLKERSREMSGLQSLVSALLYACHSEKQVHGKKLHTCMCVLTLKWHHHMLKIITTCTLVFIL